VILPAGITGAQLTQAELDAATTKSGVSPTSVVIGIDWDLTNYAGSNAVWTGSQSCTSVVSYDLPYVGDGWNDMTSSAKGYSGCNRYRHFEHSQFGGASILCSPNCATMEALNNLTSSEKFRHA
jgi:hypothetical protein